MDTAPPFSSSRRPRAVRWLGALVAVGLVAVLLLGAMELGARALGLGDPILYYSTVEGGVRPLARQASERVGGARVTIDENGFRSVSTVPTADSSAGQPHGEAVVIVISAVDSTLVRSFFG